MMVFPRGRWWLLFALVFPLAAASGDSRPATTALPNTAPRVDDPVITEFMAANGRTLADEDNDFSDWIEIHNPSTAALELEGWALTDRPSDLTAWLFPDMTLEPGEYIVVYASGKNRRLGTFWNSVVQAGDSFRYFPGTEQPADDWTTAAFSDSLWSEGPSPLGYERDVNGAFIATPVAEGLLSLYTRIEFSVDDPADVLQMLIHIDYDDGFIAYLNGEEIARRNVTASEPRYDTPSEGGHEAVIYQGGIPDRFDVADPQSALRAGRNVLAVEVHNISNGSSDLTISPFVTLETATPPSEQRGVAAELGPLGARNLHTNFSLDRDGEYLALVNPAGEVISEYDPYPTQHADVSYGVPANGAGEVDATYLAAPTPGAANAAGLSGVVDPPTFSAAHGIYQHPFSLFLFPGTSGTTIRYTTDGSQPTDSTGAVYTAPIRIDETTVVRAAGFKQGARASAGVTRTFLFLEDVIRQSANGRPPAGWPSTWGPNAVDYGMDPQVVNGNEQNVIQALSAIPSFSIAMERDSLFNRTYGIYANALSYGREWERPASIELIYPEGFSRNSGTDADHGGGDGFQVNAGVRIRGGWSRNKENPKHAFRLFFRGEYGPTELEYALFGDEGADRFDKIDLRTAQNYSWSYYGDQRNTFVRDVFARDTQRDMGELYTRSRYYHLYLNGQYWGLFQTQERADGSYGASYLGGDDDDFDIIKSAGLDNQYVMEATAGNVDAWRQLWEGANRVAGETENARSDDLYLKLQGLNPDGSRNPDLPVLLDADNLINYMLVIFWTGNPDAPITPFMGTNNFFAIRDRTGERGFVYFAHDSEHTLLPENGGFYDRTGPFTAGDQFQFSNPQWIHQQLMGSREYRLRFADLARKHLFDDGALVADRAIARWNARAAEVESVILAESARWGDAKSTAPLTPQHWATEVERVRSTVLPTRAAVVIEQLKHTRRFAGGNSGANLVEAPLYPSVPAPEFSHRGGDVPSGFTLDLTGPSDGRTYYTIDGSDPRRFGGDISPTAEAYDGTPLQLSGRVSVKARALVGDEWSALTEGEFFVDTARPEASTLAITELYYHPTPPTTEEHAAGFTSDEALEFIELHNTSSSLSMHLAGLSISEAVDVTFADVALAPDERAVVVADSAAFRHRFGAEPRVLGSYDGRLNNAGETITLLDRDGSTIITFSFDDGGDWPSRADGNGSSLELVDSHSDYTKSSSWRASSEYNGSPGLAGSGPRTDVVVNEILTHTDEPELDAVELHNTGDAAVNISGWYLSDSRQFRKYAFPEGTIIDAGGYTVVDERDFNASRTHADFAFNGAYGDEVWLVAAGPDGAPVRFVDHVAFGAARNGEAFGRWPNGTGELFPMREKTLGGANSSPRGGNVVLREIMFHPPGNNENLEYVVLFNAGTSTETLTSWELRDGVEYTFGGDVDLEPGDSLVVVAFDPILDAEKASTFRTVYGWSETLRLVGGWSGRLANEGEMLTLMRPDEPPADNPGFVPQTVEERVVYDDESPWPMDADGKGASLRRAGESTFSGDPGSWQAFSRPFILYDDPDGPAPPPIPGSGYVLSSTFPNPAAGRAAFTLAVGESQAVRVTLFDVLGRRVREVYAGTLESDRLHEIAIDGAGLASGLYLMQIVGREFAASRTVTFVR